MKWLICFVGAAASFGTPLPKGAGPPKPATGQGPKPTGKLNLDLNSDDPPTGFLPDEIIKPEGPGDTTCPSRRDVSTGRLARFGLELFEEMTKRDKGASSALILSPLAVSAALALLQAGATPNGAAEAQLTEVLGLEHAEVAAVSKLVTCGDQAEAANAIFTTTRPLEDDYVSLVNSVHGARAMKLEGTFQPLNRWVENVTHGKIKNLMADPPSDGMVAALVAVLYFKAPWAHPFEPGNTEKDGVFTTAEGSEVSADFMRRTAPMRASPKIASLGGAAAVNLTYGLREYYAILVLPDNSGGAAMAKTVKALAAADPAEWLKQLSRVQVALKMPKFKAQYGTETILEDLRQVGLDDALPQVNLGAGLFNGISDEAYVADVLTKAVLEVDEAGTVAAAAAVVATVGAAYNPEPPLELTFDRPFLFLIFHAATQLPLFVAQINSV